MEQLPIYISIIFVFTTLLTLLLFYKAANYSKPVFSLLLVWLIFQAFIGFSGFYTVTNGMPPRFALLILPPIFLILGLFISKTGRIFIDGLQLKMLTLLHIVRIPVELTLLMLYLHRFVPEEMTFEGRNFDIISGLTAPLVYYFGFIKKRLNRKILLAWNIICLILLINIVSTAILSAPFFFSADCNTSAKYRRVLFSLYLASGFYCSHRIIFSPGCHQETDQRQIGFHNSI